MDLLKISFISLLSAAIFGCDGGMSSNSSKATQRPAGSFEGVVADNLIKNADVTVYRLGDDGKTKEIIQSTKTDAAGNYKQAIKAKDSFVKICASNGSYTEEATGTLIKMGEGQKLCAVAYYQSGRTHDVMVTPETNIAAALVECEAKRSNDSLNNIVSDANSKVGSLFGYDILKTKPDDILGDDSKLLSISDGVRSSFWHAGYSQLTLEIAKANKLEKHTDNINSITLHSAIYDDISSDCVLDGKGKNNKQLAFGLYKLTTKTYRTELPRSLAKFVQSSRNKTNVTLSNLIVSAQQFSQSTDSIYPISQTPVLYDEDAPQISISADNGQYVSDIYNLVVNVTDYSGIEEVYINIGDEKKQGYLENGKYIFVINTKNFEDGDLKITIHAKDTLQNRAETDIKLMVANKSGEFKLDSPRIVKAKEYPLSVSYDKVESGIKSASLNGKPISFDDKRIYGDASLTNGVNYLYLTVVDNSDKKYEFTYQIKLDSAQPVVTLNIPTSWQATIKENGATQTVRLIDAISQKKNLLISPDKESLDTALVTFENLLKINFPTLVFDVSDPKIAGVFSNNDKLKAKLAYIRSREDKTFKTTVFERPVPITGTKILIPLSKEYLGKGWSEVDADRTRRTIKLSVSDEAGNIKNVRVNFNAVPSKPSVELDIPSGYFGGFNKESIPLIGNELNGSEIIKASVNGFDTVDVIPSNGITIAKGQVIHGDNYVDITLKSGDTTISKRIQFKADLVLPSALIQRKQYTNKKNIVLTGTVQDADSGVDSVVIANKRATITGNTFSVSIDLSDRINHLEMLVSDKSGNVYSSIVKVYYDTMPPLLVLTSMNPAEYETKYFSAGQVANGDLIFNDVLPHYLSENQLSFNNAPVTEETLGANNRVIKYLFIPFGSVDLNSNRRVDEASTPDDKIKITYSLKVGGVTRFQDKPFTLGFRLLPITTEFLNSESGVPFYRDSKNKKYEVIFKSHDLAGNVSTMTVSFYLYIEPTKPTIGYRNLLQTKINDYYAMKWGIKIGQYVIKNNSDYPITVNLKSVGEHVHQNLYGTFEKVSLHDMTIDDEYAVLSNDKNFIEALPLKTGYINNNPLYGERRAHSLQKKLNSYQFKNNPSPEYIAYNHLVNDGSYQNNWVKKLWVRNQGINSRHDFFDNIPAKSEKSFHKYGDSINVSDSIYSKYPDYRSYKNSIFTESGYDSNKVNLLSYTDPASHSSDTSIMNADLVGDKWDTNRKINVSSNLRLIGDNYVLHAYSYMTTYAGNSVVRPARKTILTKRDVYKREHISYRHRHTFFRTRDLYSVTQKMTDTSDLSNAAGKTIVISPKKQIVVDRYFKTKNTLNLKGACYSDYKPHQCLKMLRAGIDPSLVYSYSIGSQYDNSHQISDSLKLKKNWTCYSHKHYHIKDNQNKVFDDICS